MRSRIRAAASRLRQSRRLTAAFAGVAAGSAAVAATALLAPPAVGLGVAAAAVTAAGAAAIRSALTLRTLRRGFAEEFLVYDARAAAALARDTTEDRWRRMERVRAELQYGFPDSALSAAKTLAADARIPAEHRSDLLRSVLDWYTEDDARRREPVARHHCDIVLITHLGLPGGNSSASAADVQAFRDLGLTVGLIHHPVYHWRLDGQPDERIQQLVDGDRVRLIGSREAVVCDLAVIRLPTVMNRPLEARPVVEARQTVVIANQTPYRFYGPAGPREAAWSPSVVDAEVRRWLGPAEWYAGGPSVHRCLTRYHSAEIAGLNLHDQPWNECIDLARWRTEARRNPDGRIRIGRHSRDHLVKWPETPERLRRAYPGAEGFEVHVLGGAETPRRMLGRLPSNWTVHPFNAMGAREFLGGIDVFVYFIASDGAEAFGRAPLEAMAAGVPVVMDPGFEPTFGTAAVYCEPEAVEATVRQLMEDPEMYAAQRVRAWEFVEEVCSPRALARRLARHGVAVAEAPPA